MVAICHKKEISCSEIGRHHCSGFLLFCLHLTAGRSIVKYGPIYDFPLRSICWSKCFYLLLLISRLLLCNVFAIAFKSIVFICVDLIIQCLLARRIFLLYLYCRRCQAHSVDSYVVAIYLFYLYFSCWFTQIAVCLFKLSRHAYLWCDNFQSFARGLIGRHQFTSIVMSRKVMAIQRYIRGWLARRHYRRIQRGIVKMQANVRRRIAKREFKELKVKIPVCFY